MDKTVLGKWTVPTTQSAVQHMSTLTHTKSSMGFSALPEDTSACRLDGTTNPVIGGQLPYLVSHCCPLRCDLKSEMFKDFGLKYVINMTKQTFRLRRALLFYYLKYWILLTYDHKHQLLHLTEQNPKSSGTTDLPDWRVFGRWGWTRILHETQTCKLTYGTTLSWGRSEKLWLILSLIS